MGPPNIQYVDLLVSELMVPGTGEWDVAKIRRILPDYESHILLIKPSLTGNPDKQVWLGTKSGTYSTKSGYYTAINTQNASAPPTVANFKWKSSVWNLQCAPKVKLFSWKLHKGALPVHYKKTTVF